MIRYIIAGSTLALLTLGACTKDSPTQLEQQVAGELSVRFSSDATTIPQLESIQATATGRQATLAPAEITWELNDQVVAHGLTYTFQPIRPGSYTLVARSADHSVSVTRSYTVQPRFTTGAFLLNEGHPEKETGTLTYVDADKRFALDSVYYRVNGTKLGGLCRDLAFAGDKIYIISEKGAVNGGEGLLTIAKASSLERIKVYNDETLLSAQPTNIAVIGEHIYLRTAKGIYHGGEEGGFALITGTETAKSLPMPILGERVFAVTSDNKVLMLHGANIEKVLELGGEPTGVAVGDGGSLWVSYRQTVEVPGKRRPRKEMHDFFAKVSPDPADFKILSSIHRATYNYRVSDRTHASLFTVRGEELYIFGGERGRNTRTEVTDYANNRFFVTTYLSGHFAPRMGNEHRYGVGLDPRNGYIYYAGYLNEEEYKENRLFVTDSKQTRLFVLREGMAPIPAGWYFIPTK